MLQMRAWWCCLLRSEFDQKEGEVCSESHIPEVVQLYQLGVEVVDNLCYKHYISQTASEQMPDSDLNVTR